MLEESRPGSFAELTPMYRDLANQSICRGRRWSKNSKLCNCFELDQKTERGKIKDEIYTSSPWSLDCNPFDWDWSWCSACRRKGPFVLLHHLLYIEFDLMTWEIRWRFRRKREALSLSQRLTWKLLKQTNRHLIKEVKRRSRSFFDDKIYGRFSRDTITEILNICPDFRLNYKLKYI